MHELKRDASYKKIGDLFVSRGVFEAWLEASRDDSDTFSIGAASLLIWEPLYHDLSVDVSPLLEDIQDVPRGNMKSDMVHMSDLMWYIHCSGITLNLEDLREFAKDLPHIHSTFELPEGPGNYATKQEAQKAEKKERASRLEQWNFLAQPLMFELEEAVSLQPEMASSSFVPSSFVEKRTVDEQNDAQRAALISDDAHNPPAALKAAKSGQHALVDAPDPGEKVSEWTKSNGKDESQSTRRAFKKNRRADCKDKC